MSGAHSLHAPSGSAKRIRCAGALAMEHDLPDETSLYAAEGTAAHTLASDCLDTGTMARDHLGRVLEADDFQFTVDEAVADPVQAYVDAVLRCASVPGAELFVERRLDFSAAIGIEGQTGTGDAVIIIPGELQVHDLKFGEGVKVDAMERWRDSVSDTVRDGPNSQLAWYALGAVEEYELSHDFDHVRLFIHQPRLGHVSEYSCTVAELRDWCALHGRPREQLAHANFERYGQLPQPQRGAELLAAGQLTPGEKQCQFCKAKATCPALVKLVADQVASDYENLTEAPDALENVSPPVAGALPTAEYLELVEDWARAARAEIERRLMAGTPVPGWKLVEGKKPSRDWADEKAAEAAMKKARLKFDEMYISKLASPPQIEKRLKKSRPRLWARFQSLITQPSRGRPSVAPESDPRPVYSTAATPDDFEVIGDPQP
jgi:hypothetical protein